MVSQVVHHDRKAAHHHHHRFYRPVTIVRSFTDDIHVPDLLMIPPLPLLPLHLQPLFIQDPIRGRVLEQGPIHIPDLPLVRQGDHALIPGRVVVMV